jgi:hypothetical protein
MGDATFREIYVDRDLSRWGSMPNPRVVQLGNSWRTDVGNVEVKTSQAGTPSLVLSYSQFSNPNPPLSILEVWYDAQGIDIGYLYYDETDFDSSAGGYATLAPAWLTNIVISADETTSSYDQTGNILGESPGTRTFAATAAGRKFAMIQFYYTGATAAVTGDWRMEFRKLAVYGRHGLEGKGEQPHGFTPDQVTRDMAARANGITLRDIDSLSYVIPHFLITTPTTPRDGITNVSEFANVDYGVWGPRSPLDFSTTGYFDYKARDTATQHWFATRSDFEDDLTFHSETQTLYDTVEVSYSTESGASVVKQFSIYSPDLQAAGLSPRVYALDAGTTTDAGAQLLAEIFLNVYAGFAPARGSGSLLGTVRHYQRGEIPAYYLRADGANIRIPDILPAETAFALDATPDRRTTFPVKRVTVDCSGDSPKTIVEFDQSTDSLATLMAQQSAEAALIG